MPPWFFGKLSWCWYLGDQWGIGRPMHWMKLWYLLSWNSYSSHLALYLCVIVLTVNREASNYLFDCLSNHLYFRYRSAQDFNLDGKPIYWLACALYDSCFSRQLVTISGESQRGNYISFTQLLKVILRLTFSLFGPLAFGAANLILLSFWTLLMEWICSVHADIIIYRKFDSPFASQNRFMF